MDINSGNGKGLVKFSNGLAIQWGRVDSPGSGSGSGVINFQLPFTGQYAYSIEVTPEYASPQYPVFDVSVQRMSGSLCNVYFRQGSNTSIITGVYATWMAIGKWK